VLCDPLQEIQRHRWVLTEHPTTTTYYRYWQEGAGYDRNLIESDAVAASIEYLHLNPVRRGLVREAVQWRWSSCRFYVSDGQEVDPALPRIHPLPAEFWLK
jgi:REP-associated tyrosine transposase